MPHIYMQHRVRDIREKGFDLNIITVLSESLRLWKGVTSFFFMTIFALFATMGIFSLFFFVFGGSTDHDPTDYFSSRVWISNCGILGKLIFTTIQLLVAALGSIIFAGFIQIVRDEDEGKDLGIGTIFCFFEKPFFKELFLCSILYSCMEVTLKTFFDFLPNIGYAKMISSILFSLLFLYTTPLIIFGNFKAWMAIKTSLLLSIIKLPQLIIIIIACFLFALSGLIGFIIGILFTFSIFFPMQYVIYKQTIGFENTEKCEIDDIGKE